MMNRPDEHTFTEEACEKAEQILQRLDSMKKTGNWEQVEAVIADARDELGESLDMEDDGTMPRVIAELVREIQGTDA